MAASWARVRLAFLVLFELLVLARATSVARRIFTQLRAQRRAARQPTEKATAACSEPSWNAMMDPEDNFWKREPQPPRRKRDHG